jgi:hypothetical protein
MFNLEIYCTALQYFSVIDKLPSYIRPLGLGNHTCPKPKRNVVYNKKIEM